jgi:hypothetical protein
MVLGSVIFFIHADRWFFTDECNTNQIKLELIHQSTIVFIAFIFDNCILFRITAASQYLFFILNSARIASRVMKTASNNLTIE